MTETSFALTALVERFTLQAAIRYAPSTVVTYKDDLADFVAFCAMHDVVDVRQVTRPLLERYQRALFQRRATTGPRVGEPLSLPSQARRISALKSFFRFLVRQGVVDGNPAADLEPPGREQLLPRNALTLQEVEHVLLQPNVHTHTGLRDRTILEVLFATGVRRQELAALSLFDIDHDKRTLFVARGKGRRQRVVPISERALHFVERYTKTARPALLTGAPDTSALFLGDRGTPLSLHSLSALVAGHIKAADVGKTGSCHVFRHTFATLLLEGGADIRHIQLMLGHAKLTTTAVYTHVAIDALVEVYERSHPAAKRPGTRPSNEAECKEG